MKTLAALISVATIPCIFSADVTAGAGDISASFMGASGGMKLFSTADDSIFLQVSQEKLEEVLSDGGKCSGNTCDSINVAGSNSWSELVTEESEEGDTTSKTYSTTFTVEESGVTFNLLAHLTNTKTTVTDNVPCTGCLDPTEGGCQASEDQACSAVIAGTGGEPDTCADGSELCTVTVEMEANELKFSMMVQGWVFADAGHVLQYGIVIKDKSGSADEEESADEGESAEEEGKVKFGDGSVTYPTTATIHGGTDATPREETVTVTTSEAMGGTLLTFTFPSFETGETLYYDPTLAMAAEGSASSMKLGYAALVFGMVITGVSNLMIM